MLFSITDLIFKTMADSQIKAKTFSDTHSSPSDNVLENNSSTEKSNSDIGFVSTDLLSNDQNSAEPYCVENQGYIIGDIVWVKIGKFPYWPSIVCIDPESNTFTKGSLSKSFIIIYMLLSLSVIPAM